MVLKKIKRIAIVYNLKKPAISHLDDRYEEYDEWETIQSLKAEFEKSGLKVICIEEDKNFLEKITRKKIDFVFNIAEGRGNTRSRESQVPCILESLNIPYFGSDPLTLGITLDKFLCQSLLKLSGAGVPLFHMIESKNQLLSLKRIFEIKKRFIVKPRWEGSSKGIFSDSVVDNFKDLKRKVSFIFKYYKQPAMIEEFIEGGEITVGVLGNTSPSVLTMMKIVLKDRKDKTFVYSLENKRAWKERIQYLGKEGIPKKVQNKIIKSAIRAFKFLDLRDIARIDFRLDKKNRPYIIDINPLPGLSPYYSDLPIAYRLAGGSYSRLIKKILKTSLARYGFKI